MAPIPPPVRPCRARSRGTGIAWLLPAPTHRALIRIAHALRKLWWRLGRPQVVGCRVLALDGKGRVLLVRHSYGSGRWAMPGGGVRGREEPLAAAIRELREETGCDLADACELLTVVENLSGAANRVHVVAGRVKGEARADGREVIEARFFARDAIPANAMRGLAKSIAQWAQLYEAGRKGN